jgi:thiol-disulfide isomerase/thioredoxin
MTVQEKSQQEKSAPKAKDILLTVVLGCFAIALLVGIRAPDSTPLTPAKPPAQRKPMPDFTMPTLNGQQWILSQHRGHVVLLNFWATWCPPCQAETPSLVKIAREYQGQGLDVAGVAMDSDSRSTAKPLVQAFVSSYHVPYPILLPSVFSPLTGWVQAYPTTLLIDRQGRVADASVGALDEGSARRELERLLKEPSGKSGE